MLVFEMEITPKEELARLHKAITLADVIWSVGGRSKDVREAANPEDVWTNASRLAHFDPDYSPSAKTREVAIGLLANREEIERRIDEALAERPVDIREFGHLGGM